MLRRLSDTVVFQHLQASDLIKAEIAGSTGVNLSSEQLRSGKVLDNQDLLIAAFNRVVGGADGLIVFDGHTLIDGATGVIEIPAHVFRSLRLSHLVFIYDAAEAILSRRRLDDKRIRPDRTIAQIEEHQARAILVAMGVAQKLKIPMTLLTVEETTFLEWLLSGRYHPDMK